MKEENEDALERVQDREDDRKPLGAVSKVREPEDPGQAKDAK